MKVTLRTKGITGSREALFLDFYPPIKHPKTGKEIRRHYLRLSVPVRAKNEFDKQVKEKTLQQAEAIRAKTQLDIQNRKYGFLITEEDGDFLEFFKSLIELKSTSNKDVWQTAYKYIAEFNNGSVRFSELNVDFCNRFKHFLLNDATRLRSRMLKISQNTAYSYFNKLKAAIKQAYIQKKIHDDFLRDVEGIKEDEIKRDWLSKEELNKLAQTECDFPYLKEAAFFSALTGLRYVDLHNLEWNELKETTYSDGKRKYIISFKQKKTRGVQEQTISEQAYLLCGERGAGTDRPFGNLIYSSMMNFHLKRWLLRAGITKNIKFHCFRHTFAALQLEAGTNLFTVSKLLGHRDIKTTMIYAKLSDKMKDEASEKIQITF